MKLTKSLRIRLLSIALLPLLTCSCEDIDSPYGSDTRWQQYTRTHQAPYKEISLPGSVFGEVFKVSADCQKALYANVHRDENNTSSIYLIDMNTGDHLLALEGHPESTQCLSFSYNGQTAVSGGRDGTVRLWNLTSGKQIGYAQGHKEYVRAIEYSPVEHKALSGADDSVILLWDIDKMQVLKRFVGHSSAIRCLAWAQDGKTFLSGSWDGSIRLWDIQTGKEIAHLQPGYGRVMGLALSPDGKYALSSYLNGPDHPVIFWDLESQQEINRFGVPGNAWDAGRSLNVESVAFSADSKTALFGLFFGTVIWWDLNEWRQIAMNRLHEEELAFVAYLANDTSCISVGCDVDSVRENAKVKFWQFPDRSIVEGN